ncbi:hypothetical protein ACJX0J_007634, partial [Zea mays]
TSVHIYSKRTNQQVMWIGHVEIQTCLCIVSTKIGGYCILMRVGEINRNKKILKGFFMLLWAT